MGDGDNYDGLQQPAGGYAGAGSPGAPAGYGDVQNPPSPYDAKKPAAPPALGLIDQVEADLKSVNLDLKGAKLTDMAQHKNHKAFEQISLAWTNSSEQIFLNLQALRGYLEKGANPKDIRALTLVAVRHEIVHVIQFGINGGPPATFTDMIRFEAIAYSESLEFWNDATTNAFLTKIIGAGQESVKDISKQLNAAKILFEERRQVNTLSDQDQLTWMKNHNYLPKTILDKANKPKADYEVGELYLL